MATTTPDNLFSPDSIGMFGQFVSDLAAMQASVQVALNALSMRSYKWANSSERNAQTGMTEGDLGFQKDTLVTYVYSGGAWRNIVQLPSSMPFAQAAGTVAPITVPAGAEVHTTVTFPSGRFTVAPIVMVTGLGAARDISFFADSVTSTNFVLSRGSVYTTARASQGASWYAVQMLSGAAAG
jgi:hypothetical protein